ncbi:MAG TPA: hypothetical protein VM847_22635 [Tahibacter sp.]|jgi:hypothetical protein|nr:hypothetical protein [Tahibacter sp.]
MRLPIVTILMLSVLAGCRTAPDLVIGGEVAPKNYRWPTERPADAERYVVLQFRSMVSPLVRVHEALPSRGPGISNTDGAWIDQPFYFLPGTARFDYTCANGRHGENVVLTFVRAGSYTLDCAPDGSLVAIGPRAPAF